MDTESTDDTRITLREAAALAGVSTRTINRWSAAGHIGVERGPSGSQAPATYSRKEIVWITREWGRPGARGSRK